MKTIENIKKVALVLFIFLGIIHMVAGLMLANGYFLPYSFWANRSLDIPFAITGVIYAAGHIYTKVGEKQRKIAGPGLITITILIFLVLIYINLFVADKIPLDKI